MITLFQTAELLVTTKGSLAPKEVLVTVWAINPVDGKQYKRGAGWISTTLTLHSFLKTPAYAIEQAGLLLIQHKEGVLASFEKFVQNNPSSSNEYYLAKMQACSARKEINLGEHYARKAHEGGRRDYWIDNIRTCQF